jgi:hypothetical protein
MPSCTLKTLGLLLLAATLSPCAVHAEDAALQARLHAAKAEAATRWVEVETLRQSARVFLSTTGEADGRGLVHVLQRVDLAQDTRSGLASEVRSVELNCERGEETLLGVRGYDAQGREVMARANPMPQPALIADFHRSTLRLVCSGDYLLPLVPELAQARTREAQEAKAERLAKVGDRAIPVVW